MLTVQKLLEMKPGQIFLIGEGKIPNLSTSDEVKWIAKRGDGYHDWTIYYHLANKTIEFIASYGDKVFTHELIKDLVHCDEESFQLYRF